jgi:hypothetical protein
METHPSINKAYRAIQGTSNEAFAILEISRVEFPIVGGYSREFYYAIVAYHCNCGNYIRLSNKITQIHV